MHNCCCACAYQLLCKRTTAVVRPEILIVSTTYPISSNNLSCLFQRHILSLPTTYPISSNDMTYLFQQQEEGESLTYDTPSFEYIVSQTLFLVSFLVKTLVKNANSWAFILFFRRIYIILHHSIIM